MHGHRTLHFDDLGLTGGQSWSLWFLIHNPEAPSTVNPKVRIKQPLQGQGILWCYVEPLGESWPAAF